MKELGYNSLGLKRSINDRSKFKTAEYEAQVEADFQKFLDTNDGNTAS